MGKHILRKACFPLLAVAILITAAACAKKETERKVGKEMRRATENTQTIINRDAAYAGIHFPKGEEIIKITEINIIFFIFPSVNTKFFQKIIYRRNHRTAFFVFAV